MGKAVIEITENAAKRLRYLEDNGDGKVLRLSVKSSGCSGHRYDLAYADAPSPGDERVEAHGATIHVDPASVLYILGTTVDWKEEAMERSFVFNNALEAGRCGCGESFHI
jgi:iron-sulfur cluster assembly protein